ncbi:hypothetical protein CEQ90_01630 [Lewinellaceae bacterium SD302]|nr:hypothetical protein CEQ90_01630 [Lewinellaceae bacterium SD302]
MDRPNHYSPLYRNLAAIDPKDHQRIIREYEYLEQQIGQLDPDEYFKLTVWYVDALFATGAHRRHLLMVDLVIFASIDRNIQFLDGKDIYQRMLFRKAASAYRILDYGLCAHICRELIRMYPADPSARQLLQRALFQQKKPTLQFGRAAAIFCFLLTALVIVIDLLVVKNFYPAEHQAVIWIRNCVFFAGVLLFAGAYGLAFYRSRRGVQQYLKTIKSKTV